MTSLAGLRTSSAIFRQCDEYAQDVLGSRKYSPWLKAYSVLSGTFREGWVPNNYYHHVVVPKLKGSYGPLSHNRGIANRLFRTDLLPDLAYSVNGLLCTSSMEVIRPGDLKKYLFATGDRVVYKADDGRRGRGVSIYDVHSFPDEPVAFGNGVFQSYVIQHPFFDEFDDHSVATIRITTVVDDESDVSCRAPFLRLPRQSETHVKAATSTKIVLGPDGELHEIGYSSEWLPMTRHPDSGKPFAHQMVPNFKECVETCVALHRRLTFPRVIGWDVIVDSQENVVVMEWNGQNNGIKFQEAAVGPCFADLGWESLWRTGANSSGPLSPGARSLADHHRTATAS
jgi:hypothetical protein